MSGTIANNLGRSSGVVGSAGSGITLDSGDPAVDTNPAGGLGTVWSNSTSGETYVCTDITAGSNVWKNVGDGTGAIEPYAYQGTQYGYCHGGENGPTPDLNVINKFSFSSDGDAVDADDLTVASQYVSGSHSTTHGYSAGGPDNHIDKYSFADGGNATDVGNLTTSLGSCAGLSSRTHGYTVGGYIPSPASYSADYLKYSYSSDGDATDVANCTVGKLQSSGATDTVHGYIMCGYEHPSEAATVEKFSYSSNDNSTDIGDMPTDGYRMGGSSSLTYGYVMGGAFPMTRAIEKFNFSGTFATATVGNIVTTARQGLASASSTTHGWHMGGTDNASPYNEIGKFAVASDGDASDVGNLTTPVQYGFGTSY